MSRGFKLFVGVTLITGILIGLPFGWLLYELMIMIWDVGVNCPSEGLPPGTIQE
jgi:hypothetical protein